MGLKVEKHAMRCAGYASKIAYENSIIGGTVHAALVDVETAPAMVAADMLTGVNNDAGKNGQKKQQDATIVFIKDRIFLNRPFL